MTYLLEALRIIKVDVPLLLQQSCNSNMGLYGL